MTWDWNEILVQAAAWGMLVLAASFMLCFWRLRRGPYLADRVLALDLMTTIVMGLFALYAIHMRQGVFVDVVVVMALVAFIGTVVFARHIERDARRKQILQEKESQS